MSPARKSSGPRGRLAEYERKRDFDRTSEPAGTDADGTTATPLPRFVVHEHSARRMHWDLRLEHDGVLASWALPRGIPDDPAHNRLAVHTEDHPLEYLDFEGDIPRGEYGAGHVGVWDRGTYELEKWRDDEVIVTFLGERLTGRYALFRTRGERDWMIHRMDPPAHPEAEPTPRGLRPMLATAGRLPPARETERWSYEIKWDGVRALAYCEPGAIRLESRNGRDITRSYPELRALGRALSTHTAVLDGEIVALDADGRPSFSRLQERMHVEAEATARRRAAETPVVYMVFDLLFLDGASLIGRPYEERRAALEALVLAGPAWQTPEAYGGDAATLLEATAEQGLEGLVAKRRDSTYEPGRRTSAWIKVKNARRQEFVIGGSVAGAGRRHGRIGALLLGYYDDEGRLVYAGRAGSGLSERALAELAQRLDPIERPDSPFDIGAPPRGSRFVAPRFVAEIQFSEWTPDGQLRHPIYKGLRDDVDPASVRREAAATDDGETLPAPRRPPGLRSATAERATRAADVFDAVHPLRGGLEVTVDGRVLRLSNYDKPLFASGFTKGDLIEYYARIAPVILSHLKDRPLTLKRYPDGVEAGYFYEKNAPSHRPDWVQTVRVGGIDYVLVQDAATLVWAANLASIELHTSLARVPELGKPTAVVFDLDPGEPAGLLECVQVALVLRGLFDGIGLESVCKTSGGKGLQVYVPLNSPCTFAATKAFARQVAELLAGEAPELVIARMTRGARAGRVFVDWSQNDEHKTTVNVYSVRGAEAPYVSTPLRWDEVAAADDAAGADALRFTAPGVLERVAALGDLFAPMVDRIQDLPGL